MSDLTPAGKRRVRLGDGTTRLATALLLLCDHVRAEIDKLTHAEFTVADRELLAKRLEQAAVSVRNLIIENADRPELEP